MFGADPLEGLAALIAMKAAHWITTQSINVVCLTYLVPESLELNRCLLVALCPQERGTFSASCNPGMLSRRSLRAEAFRWRTRLLNRPDRASR